MINVYYVDTCVWSDYYEGRYGTDGRPLGKYAMKFFLEAIKNKDEILISELTLRELKKFYDEIDMELMFSLLSNLNLLKIVTVNEDEIREANDLTEKYRDIPMHDILHAVVSKKHNAILVTQDKHFKKLKEITRTRTPQAPINSNLYP